MPTENAHTEGEQKDRKTKGKSNASVGHRERVVFFFSHLMVVKAGIISHSLPGSIEVIP